MDIYLTINIIILLSIQLANTTLASNTWDAEIEHCVMEQNGTILRCNYIPQDIPPGFSSVYIETPDLDISCNDTSFSTKCWQQVETLKIIDMEDMGRGHVILYDNCFKNLKNLMYLGIHVSKKHFYIFPNTFQGINSVVSLSFSGCIRLDWNSLLQALNGTDHLKNLTELNLDKVHSTMGPVNLNTTVANILGYHSLTSLSLSGMQVSSLNLTALMFSLQNLKFFNFSSVNLNEFRFSVYPEFFGHVEDVDISHMHLPKSATIGDIILHNFRKRYDGVSNRTRFFLEIKTSNVSGILSKNKIELYNCEFILNMFIPMQTRTLILHENNLKYIDVKISGDTKYRNTSIEHIDVSQTSMEFINPSMLTLIPNLISLCASQNRLNNMLLQDTQLFEQLFYTNSKLKILDLSSNGLETIPTYQFIHNVNLEEITLSNNQLQQVHWKMDNLTQLRTLDLRYNRISNLDSTSLNNLNSLIASLPASDQLVLKIENNPISCSQCENKLFITWLTKTTIVDLSTQKLTCTGENNQQELIEDSVLQKLESICYRKTIIIVCSATLGTAFICAVSLTFILLRHRKMRRQQEKHNQLLANIQQGEGEFEFVTMLSYYSQEEDFIRHYVLEPLNNTLQIMTSVDRELVLTGDQHFRPGFMLNNEIASSLERVSLVLLLITNEFCTSGYCLSELDQAWLQHKPMIFMFKEEVDESLMTPMMKTIYKKNVRILWTIEDGEYKLKTSWENVCTAILKLIMK